MSDIQHKRSLWMGALCSTLAPPVLFFLVALLLQPRVPSTARLLKGLGDLFAIAIPVSLLATICLGLPLVFLLRSFKALTWRAVCFGAIVIGAASFALFSWLITGGAKTPGPFPYFFGAFFGFISGVAFCVGVGLQERDDRHG